MSYPVDMPRTALRLLLALCLILNGIGNAMAAVARPAMSGTSHNAVLVMTNAEAQSGTAGCGHAESAQAAADSAAPSSPANHPADCAKDCCEHGACTCPCIHIAQAALPEMKMPESPSGRTRMVPVLTLGHSTPAPLNLIRPPIS